MKKILTASLVAMMAVTAANANIASTEYIADKVLGGELSTLSTTAKKVVPAINELKTAVTDAGSAASGALAAAKSELEGKITTEAGAREAADTALDGKITAEKEAREAADTTLDGKITALDTETTNALALKEDKANKVTDTYDENSEVQYPSMKLVTKLISESEEGSAADLNELTTKLNQEVTDRENADATNLQTAKDYADSQDAAQTITITNAYTAAIKTETDARTAKDTELQNAINAINNSESGILAEAKEYADTQDATQTATLQGEIATAKSGAEATAQGYTDAEIAKIDTAYKAADSTLQGAIDAINNDSTGVLATAKKYADDQDAAQTNTITTAYTSAIATAKDEAIDQANKHSDTADSAQTTALQQYADQAEADAIAAAKAAGDSAYAAKSYEARVEGNETDISGIKTNLGPLDVKIPAACAAGETCSLVMKKGQVAWEVISY